MLVNLKSPSPALSRLTAFEAGKTTAIEITIFFVAIH
jgi:hypothetical protein